MLHVYNTLTRRKEPFHKPPGERVTMYLCGPTVYKPSHIGHMVGPVIFDAVKRYLTFLGYRVEWVINITDVDDKLIKRAADLGTTVPALAEQMTQDYFSCLRRLNVTGVDKFPRATEYIAGMIEMIGVLIVKGYAYPAGGDVYFDVSRDADYGKLCNRDPAQLEAGARIEVSEKKRNPGDFALWKGAKPGEPKEVTWDSPWGPGRPGWHIECSVMSTKLLGTTLDIHGGGLDLQFPHHENELAQSESATGETFARFWMHNGLLKMGAAKMAGSVGNVVNIADLLERHHPETIRFLLLSTHYRSPIEYSDDRLAEVAKSLQAFHRFFERYERIRGESFFGTKAGKTVVRADVVPWTHTAFRDAVAAVRTRFLDAMDDDFNTGAAVGILFELLGELNKFADQQHLDASGKRAAEAVTDFAHGTAVLRELADILGLFWEAPPTAKLGGDDRLVAGLMALVIELRNNLRAMAKTIPGKDDPTKKALFTQTDLIRARLGELKIILEDRPDGTTWRAG
jgi:cysteinyl-tRNA synthetase